MAARPLWLAPIIAALALLASPAPRLGAETVATVVRGVEPDGSERLLEDVALLWRAHLAYDGSALTVRQQADPRARLQAVRLGRALFAVLGADAYAALRPDYPDVAVLSVLGPVPVHVLSRSEPGPLRAVPDTIVFTAHAFFAADAFAQFAAAGAPLLPPPARRSVDPLGAIELLRRGVPPDMVVLIAVPVGTRELAAALAADPALRLRPLAAELQEAVTRDRPWVFNTSIPRGTYPNQADALDAPSTQLLLVTLPQLPQDDAKRMLDCLYGRRDLVVPVNPLFALVDRRANTEVAKWAPYHATAMKEFGIVPAPPAPPAVPGTP